MENKSRILEAVRANKPSDVELPSLNTLEPITVPDPLAAFRAVVTAIGGTVLDLPDSKSIGDVLALHFPEAKQTASTLKAYKGSVALSEIREPKDLEALDVFICQAVLGVAENGAVWVPESHMGHRVAPFITQHLVVLLKEWAIVDDMHAAYQEIDAAEEGFGLFIAGPSKTADIEQSLVLGAHGPRSMTVLLLKSPMPQQ